jgi:hypothetical protein
MGGIIGKLVYVLQRFYRRNQNYFFPHGHARPAAQPMRADSGEEKKLTPPGPALPAPTSLRYAAMSRRRFDLPTPPPAAPAPGAFMMMPVANLSPEQLAWQCALYDWALKEAQAVVQPSILERDLLGVWN